MGERAPDLGPSVPRRGNRLTRLAGRWALRALGWRFSGGLPDLPRMVVIVAPHTSNWDFIVGVAAMFALGLELSWIGKHTLFRGPLGMVMRWLGGIPVRRGQGSGLVAEAVEQMRSRHSLVLAIAPEGTRSGGGAWRRGFLHIATGASVPVVPAALDWSRREVRFGPAFDLSGDNAADEQALRDWYGDAAGRRKKVVK